MGITNACLQLPATQERTECGPGSEWQVVKSWVTLGHDVQRLCLLETPVSCDRLSRHGLQYTVAGTMHISPSLHGSLRSRSLIIIREAGSLPPGDESQLLALTC